MKGTIVFVFSLVLAFSFFGCKKNNSDEASILYGKWSKGTNWGDTLWFFNRDGRNILSYQISFNPASPAQTEIDYSYANGKLNISFSGLRNDFSPVESFTWKQYGQEFEIQGIELFYILSSTQVYFTYHKIP